MSATRKAKAPKRPRSVKSDPPARTREPAPKADEFAAFETLARKLVSVSKAEIDAKRAVASKD